MNILDRTEEVINTFRETEKSLAEQQLKMQGRLDMMKEIIAYLEQSNFKIVTEVVDDTPAEEKSNKKQNK